MNWNHVINTPNTYILWKSKRKWFDFDINAIKLSFENCLLFHWELHFNINISLHSDFRQCFFDFIWFTWRIIAIAWAVCTIYRWFKERKKKQLKKLNRIISRLNRILCIILTGHENWFKLFIFPWIMCFTIDVWAFDSLGWWK